MSEVAVIIPTYQPGNYLARCLSSLENQTLHKSRFCVYLALNGPRHPYEEGILKTLSLMDFRFRYIYIEKAGVSNARNVLLNASCEEYVAFVDDDDVLSEGYLEGLLKVTDRCYMGICQVFNFRVTTSNPCDNYIGLTFSEIKCGERFIFKVRKYFSSPWAKLLHRSMIGDVRFDTSLARGEDSLFMAKLSKRVIGVHKAPLSAAYYVFERPGSASRKPVIVAEEIARVFYLVREYTAIVFSAGYERLFILSRIAATILYLFKLIKFG